MKILFTDDEFKKAAQTDVLPLLCEYCKKTFYVKKRQLKRALSSGSDTKFKFCSYSCYSKFNFPKINVSCENCGISFTRSKSAIGEHTFCSHKCSAEYNNKHRHRKDYHSCKYCAEKIPPSRTVCDKHLKLTDPNRTLGDLFSKPKYQRYSKVRELARRVMTNSDSIYKCYNCGYDKHVEVCHIKAIKDFPLTTKISEINSLSNLVYLCPNCHWEFDKGLLVLPGGIEPLD